MIHVYRVQRAFVSIVLLLGLGTCLGLGACSDDTVRTFGSTRDAAGTTQARNLPLLSVPPSLSQLPAREGGNPSPQDTSAAELGDRDPVAAALPPPASVLAHRRPGQAFSGKASSSGGLSPGQAQLLAASGPTAPADIRARVTRDAQLGTTSASVADAVQDAPEGGSLIQRQTPSFWSRLF